MEVQDAPKVGHECQCLSLDQDRRNDRPRSIKSEWDPFWVASALLKCAAKPVDTPLIFFLCFPPAFHFPLVCLLWTWYGRIWPSSSFQLHFSSDTLVSITLLSSSSLPFFFLYHFHSLLFFLGSGLGGDKVRLNAWGLLIVRSFFAFVYPFDQWFDLPFSSSLSGVKFASSDL